MASVRSLGALIATCAIIFFTPMPAFAQSTGDALSQCLVGRTTGDERVLLVRWMTLAFASHPAVQDAVTVDASKMDQANRDVAKLVTDLLTNRCAEQTKAAVTSSNNPSIAIQTAFQALGGAAAREVIGSPEVVAAMSGYSKYLDKSAFLALLQPK